MLGADRPTRGEVSEVVYQCVPSQVASGGRAVGPVSYHVALDTMMGRRSRHRPDEVAIDGFLLLDTGAYELVTAYVPLDVFWKMKVLDILGHVRTENRAKVARPNGYPQVGSVWSVDGTLEVVATGSGGGARTPSDASNARNETGETEDVVTATPGGLSAGAPTEKAFRLHVETVYALDRVAIEPEGPRFIETLHVRDMLTEIRD